MTAAGELIAVARGAIATAWAFRHGPGAHRDPAEEAFDQPTLVLTTVGRWAIAGPRARGIAGPDVAVVAGAETAYRCRHEDARPADRTLAVTFGLSAPLASDEALQELVPPASITLVRLEPRLASARAQLVAATHAAGPLAGLELDLAAVSFLARARTIAREITPAPRAAEGGIDRAVRLIRADPLAPLDLARLAAVAGVSPFHFARRFRALVGESPIAHLRRLRLEHAAELLREGASVTEVAHRVGYADSAHLATAFRRAFGQSPSQLSRAAQERRTAQAG